MPRLPAWLQVIVEMDCIWSGDQDVQMVIKPIPHLTMAPDIVSNMLSTMIQLRVRVDDCHTLHAAVSVHKTGQAAAGVWLNPKP